MVRLYNRLQISGLRVLGLSRLKSVLYIRRIGARGKKRGKKRGGEQLCNSSGIYDNTVD